RDDEKASERQPSPDQVRGRPEQEPAADGKRDEPEREEEQHRHEDEGGREEEPRADLEAGIGRRGIGKDQSYGREHAGSACRRDDEGQRRCRYHEGSGEKGCRVEMATPDPAGLALTYGADVLVDVGMDAGRARRTLSRYG